MTINKINMLQTDHDLLIELRTRMEDIKNDIKDLKDGTNVKLASHEDRIVKLEKSNSKYFITMTLYSVAVGTMIALIIFHILQT